jgi:receptor expression-enhancing protein 5/6
MGLVVLALRCYLVFQNVFITFKTLKLPPPSSRNGGQPSIRALTQRKRDMKGCMAIWIVWVSRVPFELRSSYSRVCSSAVWLFMNH